MRDLGQIQRWMQSVIMHPDGVAEGMADDKARHHIDVSPEEAERVVTRSRSLSALARLAIYSNAYHARLVECLREEFPILARALGEETFDAFAIGYLQRYPSQSYTLIQLGARFPSFLAETAPPGEEDAAWAGFLVDLATLEWTFSEVFDGPGVEGLPLLDVQRCLDLPPERLPEIHLVPVECLRLLALRYPVHRYYAAARADEEPPLPEPADTYLAVTRRNFVVRHIPLSRTGFVLLQALCAGQSLGEACATTARTGQTDMEQLAVELRGWFQQWAAEGFFREVVLPKAG